MTIEQAVQVQYDEIAATYDARWQPYLQGTLAPLVEWLPLRGTERLLDLACGTGELSQRLVAAYPDLRVTGLDLSANMLRMAQQKLRGSPHLALSQGSVSALPFEADSFTLIVVASAFHHFPDPVATLREMRRVLQPGGQVVILDWCRDYLICQLYDRLLKWREPAHQTCYTQRELEQLLRAAGFSVAVAHRFRWQAWGLMVVRATAPTKALENR